MSLEFEYLLKGISVDQPCGVDCSFSSDFHVIKKAKTRDDPLLDQGDWISEPKQADWQLVHDKTIELLSEKTKDIRLYTWLIEAWSHLYGFEGIARGLELTKESLERYWLTLHPQIEEDDLDQRLGLLQGLIVQLPTLIKQVPLVSSTPFYSLGDYEAFLHQRNTQLKQQQDDYSENNAVQDLESFEQSLLKTPKMILSQNEHYLQEIHIQWQHLKNTLDHLLGLNAPSFSSTDSQLELIFFSIKCIYKTDTSTTLESQINTPQPHTPEIILMNTSSENIKKFQPQAQSHLANRQQAIQLLQDIARYFQSHEPHSPVSYMLQKTIKWSQMPLHEWLAQVIKNENPVEHVHELLGVHTNDETKTEW
ncbi:type VI secretion system protein TssA [Acinetobacter sp. BY484]|uniref:type VI secretion system protein TssA n=1 Tax=Acinetobacter sp. BY484 TaxID=2820674 RepID=UPI001C22DD2D|nr:type VI secretion system protein TssA [Acinetobacter sp. BY484]